MRGKHQTMTNLPYLLPNTHTPVNNCTVGMGMGMVEAEAWEQNDAAAVSFAAIPIIFLCIYKINVYTTTRRL